MLIGGKPRSKNPIRQRKNRKYASRLLSFVAHVISRVLGHTVTKFQQYTHVFEVQLFTGIVDDVTKSRTIPEIDMAAAQTESNTISAHRTARNKIPTPTPTLSMSPGLTTLSPTQPHNRKSRYTGNRYG